MQVLCISDKVYYRVSEVFLIYLKLRRVMKSKNNNLNKSYVNLHENMKDNSYFFVKIDIFESNFQ